MMQYVRQLLFNALNMDAYLTVIRSIYFPVFRIGLLKKNPVYAWHYFVKKLIRNNDVIIDIGANMGYYSAVFSKLAGRAGVVYCVEPVAPLVSQLKKQVKKKSNVTILPFALGGENRDRVLLGIPEYFSKTSYLHHGLFSILTDHTLKGKEFVFHAPMRKGSEVFAGLSRIDYIKCDVEGYEQIIFDDMAPLLMTHQPMVQVEISGDHFSDLVDSLENLGYQAFKLEQEKLIPLATLPPLRQRLLDTFFVPPRFFTRVKPFVEPGAAEHLLPKPVKHADLQPHP